MSDDLYDMSGEERSIKEIEITYEGDQKVTITADEILSAFYSFIISRDDQTITLEGTAGNNDYFLMQLGRLLKISDTPELIYQLGLREVQRNNQNNDNETEDSNDNEQE
jgi:hypothetical protein